MLDKLRLMCNKYIELYKNKEEVKKYILIKEILSNDNCFLNIDIEYAYSILRDLNIPEKELRKVYIVLISELEKDI